MLTPTELRDRFNDGRYWERTLTNEFVLVRARNPLASPGLNQPEATRSQVWEYYIKTRQGRKKVAVVHQLLRPDGKLGGWGRPDPKWLFEDGVEYYVP